MNYSSFFNIFFKSYFWIVPFIACASGYYGMRLFAFQESFQTPCVIGYHIHDAIRTLSIHNLNVRILAEKQEGDVPQGIVISQSPDNSLKVKAHQSVYLVVTCKPPQKKAPSLINLSEKDVIHKAKQENIYLKRYFLESIYPKNICLAQSFSEKEFLDKNSLTVYVSSGSTPIRIFPSLKNRNLSEVKDFLDQNSILYNIFYKEENAQAKNSSRYVSNSIIIDQKPLAGSLINLDKHIKVQLTVQ